MEVPRLQPEESQAPKLRLLEGKRAAPEVTFASLRAWILLFGSLAFSGGHGVFLFTALTRLQKLPGQGELGSGFQLAVLAWFLVAPPLAFASVAFRRRFIALSTLAAWSAASGVLALTLCAFGYYLRAVALA